MFNCDRCGLCCRNLTASTLYADLDRGDGVCKYLAGNLCSIYEMRPIKCRVDECYDRYFKDLMSIEVFYEMNYEICRRLKEG